MVVLIQGGEKHMANRSDGGIVLSVNIDSSNISSDMKKVIAEINKQVQSEAKNLKAVESVNQAKEKTAQLQQQTEKAIYNTLEAESKALKAEEDLASATEKRKAAVIQTKKEHETLTQEQQRSLQEIENTGAAQEKHKQAVKNTEIKQNELLISEEKYKKSVNDAVISEEKLKQSVSGTAIKEEQVAQAINKSIVGSEKIANIDGAIEQSAQRRAEVENRVANTVEQANQKYANLSSSISSTVANADDLTQSELELTRAANQTAISSERVSQAVVNTQISQEKLKQSVNDTAVSEEKVVQAKQKSLQATTQSEIAEQKLKQETERTYQAEQKTAQSISKTTQEQQKILINEQKIKQEKEKSRQAQEKTKQEIIKTKQAQKSLKTATSSVTQAFRRMASTLGLAFSVRQILNFANAASKLASQTEASVQRLGMLYGESAQEVYDWANANATALGMSKTAAYQAAAAYGNIFSTFASAEESADLTKDVLQATAVIASQTGRTYEETFEKIQSGLYGNTRAIDDLGISVRQSSLMQTEAYKQVSQNGQKSWNDLTDAELQQVRALAIVEQATAKYGTEMLQTTALTRSQFSAAFEDFKSTFGQVINIVLMPILRVLTQIFNAATQALQAILKMFGKELTVTSSSMQGIGDSASGISDSIDEATDSQKAYNKEVKKTLAGFDELEILQSGGGDSSGSGDTATPTVSGGIADSAISPIAVTDSVDNGTLTMWDDFLKTLEKIKEIFMSGFWLGFKTTDFSAEFKDIKNAVESIANSFSSIFSDETLIKSAENLVKKLIHTLGTAVGSVFRVGKTIAENLIIGFSSYLSTNADFIKTRLTGLFDISTKLGTVVENWFSTFADVFSVLAETNGTKITENIIGIFINAALGLSELALEMGTDFLNYLIQPIQDNSGALKTVLDGILGFFANVTSGIKILVDDLVENVLGLYKNHISPLIKSLTDTISSMVTILLEKWNTYIQPLLDTIGKEFMKLVEEKLKPMFDKVSEFIANVIDIIIPLWKNVLEPIVLWIWNVLVSRILRAGKNILQSVWDTVKRIISFISDGISNMMDFLNGIIEFFKGVFTGDLETALSGLKKAVKAPINQIINLVENAINFIINSLNVFVGGLDGIVGAVGDIFGKDWQVPKIKQIEIPRLAKGAVIPANREFLAVLGDQKSGTNVEAPAALIKEMAKEAILELGVSGTQNQQVVREEHYHLNETELMNVLYKLVTGGQRLNGISLVD